MTPTIRTLALLIVTLAVILPSGSAKAQKEFETRYETSKGKESAEYQEAIDFYERLAKKYPEIQIKKYGMTDSGWPLHVVMYSFDRNFDIEKVRSSGRGILLINNGIHPGETDGIDASMMMLRNLAAKKEKHQEILSNTFIAIIPVYNIGGALNRNQFTRANQNGPAAYGFRGNARNFDLNRDFIKCDTKNAQSFAQIFHDFDPDILLDTHVSNGSDHQHVMTTSHSQKDKLGGKLGPFFDQTLEKELFAAMKKDGYHTIPYVNSFRGTPDQGFPQFLETPRYSTGYTALFQTPGFMTESHMLKPYTQRVDSTGKFLWHTLTLLAKHRKTLRDLRQQDRAAYHLQKEVAVSWKVDPTRKTKLLFEGFEGKFIKSKVTAGNRLLYDRSKPFSKKIDYYNHYVADKKVSLPAGYVIPKGWHKAIELLRLNRIKMTPLTQPIELEVEAYRIENVSSVKTPYEGHYYHDNVKLSTKKIKRKFQKGDLVINIHQPGARYLVETLEPLATDSFFRWNYFDTVLQQKEYYSSYIFENTAEKMLAEDAKLKKEFEQKKKDDSSFRRSRSAQLQFLFERSKHYEPAHRTYPVFRLVKFPKLSQ